MFHWCARSWLLSFPEFGMKRLLEILTKQNVQILHKSETQLLFEWHKLMLPVRYFPFLKGELTEAAGMIGSGHRKSLWSLFRASTKLSTRAARVRSLHSQLMSSKPSWAAKQPRSFSRTSSKRRRACLQSIISMYMFSAQSLSLLHLQVGRWETYRKTVPGRLHGVPCGSNDHAREGGKGSRCNSDWMKIKDHGFPLHDTTTCPTIHGTQQALKPYLENEVWDKKKRRHSVFKKLKKKTFLKS